MKEHTESEFYFHIGSKAYFTQNVTICFPVLHEGNYFLGNTTEQNQDTVH